MNSKICCLVIFLFLSIISFGQKQANVWYYGRNSGLDFDSGSPHVLEDGALNTFEGVSSISDFNGNLLFYTDGLTVYNKNHSIMANGFGLAGHPSSTQSGVIVPLPLSGTRYLVFTVDYVYNAGDLCFSIVDMSLNGGLGAVVTKNTFLQTSSAEKITAVNHSNMQDIWVVIHERGNNVFRSYLVTKDGVTPSSVVSSTGPALGTNGEQGYLKISPDGSTLAMASYHNRRIDISTFNNSTGHVTYSFGFNYPDATYGVEFSKDSKMLYATVSYDLSQIYQIQLSSQTNTLIATLNSALPGALQLGPDGKIYVARYLRPTNSTKYLGVINNPEVAGPGCNYIDEAIYLGSGSSTMGLPTFIQSYFDLSLSIEATNSCESTPSQFNAMLSPDLQANLDWMLWNFGDPASPDNTSAVAAPLHIFSSPGVYKVTFTMSAAGIQLSRDISVAVWESPPLTLPDSISFCPGENADIDAGAGSFQYAWSNQSTTFQITVDSPGDYWVRKTNANGCYSIDTTSVIVYSVPVLDFGPDVMLCSNDGILLQSSGFESYTWQNGSTDSTFMATVPAIYSLEGITYDNCIVSDEIQIFPCCEFSLFVPNAFTPNADGYNDVFKPVIVGSSQYRMTIANRWGMILFTTSDMEVGWDGRYQNSDCPEGVYFIVLEYNKCELLGSALTDRTLGAVTLLRSNPVN
ncbi:MAG: gliding motility-associated C-terminal domain-containing protein [Bacteroidales bacterium]|nr:gliding motility-associated C-terminal domain-containing protein [Bacteroidales bacterium]